MRHLYSRLYAQGNPLTYGTALIGPWKVLLSYFICIYVAPLSVSQSPEFIASGEAEVLFHERFSDGGSLRKWRE